MLEFDSDDSRKNGKTLLKRLILKRMIFKLF